MRILVTVVRVACANAPFETVMVVLLVSVDADQSYTVWSVYCIVVVVSRSTNVYGSWEARNVDAVQKEFHWSQHSPVKVMLRYREYASDVLDATFASDGCSIVDRFCVVVLVE